MASMCFGVRPNAAQKLYFGGHDMKSNSDQRWNSPTLGANHLPTGHLKPLGDAGQRSNSVHNERRRPSPAGPAVCLNGARTGCLLARSFTEELLAPSAQPVLGPCARWQLSLTQVLSCCPNGQAPGTETHE